jgi:acetyl-CoA C-acetyltransferase
MKRTWLDPAEVGQVVGGCVGQVGMQSMNVTRSAWLAAGLPLTVPATTIDAQCGSSQQAATLAYSLVASGVVDTAVACGVEVMSKVFLGSTTPKDPDVGKPINRTYWQHYEFTTQYEGAERVAERWGITRADTDAFGLLSQQRSALALAENRFADQLMPIRRPDGVHTAGTSSQIADGAAAVLLMTAERARTLGLTPLATIVDCCLVGCDPVLMLEGPIPATRKLLDSSGLSIGDLDVIEINEAFASIVLAWERELKADMTRVNPNGGAIALGHPLGATGTMLSAKAVHELIRTDGEYGLVTMCCGGGLGTGTLLRRG